MYRGPTQKVAMERPAGSSSGIQVQQDYLIAATRAKMLGPLGGSTSVHKNNLPRLDFRVIAKIFLEEHDPIGAMDQP